MTGGGDRYAIPQVNLLELVRLDSDQARTGIETIQGARVYRLRGNLLPLVYLHEELGVEMASGDDDAINIVVLQADDRQFGLVVEGVSDTEEIVVKPLGHQLKGLSAFAGATIMGDGRVALILDVLGVAQQARVVDEVRDRALVDPLDEGEASRADRQEMLLAEIGDGGRLAIPLRAVDRLEELSTTLIERAGGTPAVQYRDRILPHQEIEIFSDSGRWTGARTGCCRSWSTAPAIGASAWWWNGSSTSSRRWCGSSGRAPSRAWSVRPSSSPG